MAGLVASVAVCCAGSQVPVPIGLPAACAACATLVLFYILYQALFFTLNGQTPGMRYARIGLCTFTDENPTRGAMRRENSGAVRGGLSARSGPALGAAG